MCTLTRRPAGDGGYDLFFNRDETFARAPERAPQSAQTASGTRYVAPADGDHGGTWLLLNAHGVTVCLLNYYPRGVVETGRVSRGSLPLACADCARADDVTATLRQRGTEPFAPFHLVAVDATGDARHLRWDGSELTESSAAHFLTSSSFEPAAVQARRAAAYAGRAADREAFHWRHDPADGAGSILMRRGDASTRSVCAVRVRPGEAVLTYVPVNWSADGLPRPGERVSVAVPRV